jgi:hypothetical protein
MFKNLNKLFSLLSTTLVTLVVLYRYRGFFYADTNLCIFPIKIIFAFGLFSSLMTFG